MVVKIGGVLYFQEAESPSIPASGCSIAPLRRPSVGTDNLESVERQRHPETDVFVGLGRTGPEALKSINPDGTYSVSTPQGHNSARISGLMVAKKPQLGYGIHTIEVEPGDNHFDIDLPPK